MTRLTFLKLSALLLMGIVLTGCATPYNRKDPLEPFNRSVFGFNEAADRVLLKPVAEIYKKVTPDPIEMAIGNFFSNLDDVVVTINDLLQFKFTEAISDGSRVLINTTFGFFGIADVATSMGLEKRNQDFGLTLGHYGITTGPYLVLPLLGPSSLRDSIGLVTDSSAFDPVYRIKPVAARNETLGVKFTDKRAQLLELDKTLEEAALDKYEFVRDAYLQRRRSQVYEGNPPRLKEDDEEESDESKQPDTAEPVAAKHPGTGVAEPTEAEKSAEKPIEQSGQSAEQPAAMTAASPDTAASEADAAAPAQEPLHGWLPVSNHPTH